MSAARTTFDPSPPAPRAALPARSTLAGVAFALTLPFCFPQPLGIGADASVLDAGPWLAWLSPLLLLAAVEGRSLLGALRRGFLFGWLGHSLLFHWIYVVTVRYGGAPAFVGVLVPGLLALYPALFTAFFAAGWQRLLQRSRTPAPLLALFAAALWTTLDLGRSFVFSGFPWGSLGYAQLGNPWLPGLARFTGVYGLSFVTVWVAASLWLWLRGRPGGRAGLAVAGALALLAHAAGASALASALGAASAPGDGRSLRIAALQGNVAQDRKWAPGRLDETLFLYSRLTREAAAAGAEWIVWPETALPAALELDGRLRESLEALAREVDAVLVVGAVGAELAEGRDGLAHVFDSAFVVRPDEGISARYDKSHLVPFGEYVPLRDWLGHFVEAIARGIASGDVTAGAGPKAIPLRAATPERAALWAGVPVCYELLFPDLVRRFVGDGAPVLLAVTNDAWYGRTGAPHQFLAITAMRAVETGVWVVRAANTGVSAVIDARGVVREASPIFEEAWVMAEVPLHPEPSQATFYVRNGDVFAGACAALTLGALVLFGAREPRVRNTDDEDGSEAR